MVETALASADEIIRALELAPHPEGGWFRETFRDELAREVFHPETANGTAPRPYSTAIYYLLKEGERSHWHKVDAVEIWHWYAGAPLSLSIAEYRVPDESDARSHLPVVAWTLGSNIKAGERPQIVVPAQSWQSASSLGDWTLVGCTVAPGFVSEGFEMAPEGWFPGKD